MSQPLSDYLIGETIGTGAFSKVKIAERRPTGELFAMKIVDKSDDRERPGLEAAVRREVSLLGILNHPHILKLIDAFEDCDNFYLLTEFASHGELYEQLRLKKSFPVAVAMRWFRQLLQGLEYLQQRSICHRDLKLENLFLDGNDSLKIGDFGFACRTKDGFVTSGCGSLHYLAPEVFSGDAYDGGKADVWSCGVILFTLLAGRLPFVDPSERGLAAKIRAARPYMPGFQPEIRDLLGKILTANVNGRYTIAQIREHPAFRIGLPAEYVLPRPLPAIVPSMIDGIEDMQAWDLAKIVVELRMRPPEIEELPWARKAGKGERADQVRVIAIGNHRSEFVMRTIQKFAGGAGFEWIHPDDREVICQRPSDGLAMCFDVNGSDSTTVNVALVRGEVDAFETLMARIVTAFQKMLADRTN
jgi:BR serine/threonine kinase